MDEIHTQGLHLPRPLAAIFVLCPAGEIFSSILIKKRSISKQKIMERMGEQNRFKNSP